MRKIILGPNVSPSTLHSNTSRLSDASMRAQSIGYVDTYLIKRNSILFDIDHLRSTVVFVLLICCWSTSPHTSERCLLSRKGEWTRSYSSSKYTCRRRSTKSCKVGDNFSCR